MAPRFEIRCINKSDRFNPHERILNVGSVNAEGIHWKLSQTEAIHYIGKAPRTMRSSLRRMG